MNSQTQLTTSNSLRHCYNVVKGGIVGESKYLLNHLQHEESKSQLILLGDRLDEFKSHLYQKDNDDELSTLELFDPTFIETIEEKLKKCDELLGQKLN